MDIGIDDIVQYLEVKPMGDLYRAFCVFHDDRNTPNLTIYPETKSFYCFSCGKVGPFEELYCKAAGLDYDQWKREHPGEIDIEKPELNFKNHVNLVISRLFFQELKSRPLHEVLTKMKRFDAKINHTAFISESEVQDYINTFYLI